jgi:hypothetical protein
MNLREFCRLPDFPTAVLTTYNIDPLFFERVVLYDLAAGGATRIFVLADAEQALPMITSAQGQLVALGRRYRLIPVRMKGSFHPKVCVRIGRDLALVASGSHNLTRSGWLGRSSQGGGGGNRESTVAWRIVPGTPSAAELYANLRELTGLLEVAADRDEFSACLRSTWLELSRDAVLPSDPIWGVFGTQSSIASVLEQRWKGRNFERLRIITGSTDRHAAMIRWAWKTFGISEAVVDVDQAFCSFDPGELAGLPLNLKIRTYDGQPRTHLKAALFESPQGSAAVVGSANCSGSAWLRTAAEGGNIESVVIYDKCDLSDFAELFRSDQGEASEWEDVPLVPQPVEKMNVAQQFRLRQLQLRRSAGELTAVLESPPPDGARVFAVVQSGRVALNSTGLSNVWRGPQPDIIDIPETLFGHVELDLGGSVELTNITWVDDLDRLAEAAGRRLPFHAVGRLSSMMISAEYKRLLDDLHLLSEMLLFKPAEFPDNPGSVSKKEKSTDVVKPPMPVTAADVIRSLAKLSSHHIGGSLASGQVGAVSLTGIMQILFGADLDTTEIDPTEAEHRKSIEEQDREHGEQQAPEDPLPPKAAEVGPTAAQRKRLFQQLKLFVDRFSAPSFAQTCSARQLQQAAAYPLAVAQFAARGPWVSHDDRSQLAEIVRRACEILFYRTQPETDVKTGDHRVRPPLVQEVRDRYAAEGRASDFDQIVGDGTLWLVVMGSLAMMGANSETRFARNLALCEVARFDLLSTTAVPEHLAPLVNRLWQDSALDVTEKVKRLVNAFEALERYAESRFDEWSLKSVSLARAGDWLWRPKVGFGQIIDLKESGKAMVHLRKRAESLPVVLSFYVNLRDISAHDERLAALVAACYE